MLLIPSVVKADLATLNWSANTEADMSFYRIYRSTTQNGTYGLIGTVAHPSTSYQDSQATPPQVWYYITAVDTTGHESGPSLKVSKSFTAYAGPSPSLLSITKVSNGQQLSWADGSSGAATTEIWRGSDNELMSVVKVTSAGVTAHLDRVSLPQTPFATTFVCYKIRHIYSNGTSNFHPDPAVDPVGLCIPWSKQDSVKPAAPGGISVTP
jgi:fibronectin type 3 domain-containing protein